MYGCYLATCEASLTAKSPYLPHGKPPCTFESLLGRYFHMESIKFPDPVQIDTDGICKKRIWSSEGGAVWHNALLIGFLMFEQRPFHVCSILRHQPWCSVKRGLICSAVLMCLSISALVHEQHMNFSTLVVSIAASIAACNGSLHSRLRASHGVSCMSIAASIAACNGSLHNRLRASHCVSHMRQGLPYLHLSLESNQANLQNPCWMAWGNLTCTSRCGPCMKHGSLYLSERPIASTK